MAYKLPMGCGKIERILPEEFIECVKRNPSALPTIRTLVCVTCGMLLPVNVHVMKVFVREAIFFSSHVYTVMIALCCFSVFSYYNRHIRTQFRV